MKLPMNSFPAVVVVLVCIVTLTTSLHAADKAMYPLGLWYEGGVGNTRDNVLPEDPEKAAAVYEQNFADIAAHGINLIVVPNSPPAHHKLVLDTAQKHGLKVILELGLDGGPFGHMVRGDQPLDDAEIQKTLDHVYAPIKDHPALVRVQIIDEPPGDGFKRFGHIADALRNYAPGALPFSCLTGGSNGDAFLKDTKLDVLTFDAYPLSPAAKEGVQKPLRDFGHLCQQFTDQANKNNAQPWTAIQCHAITGQLRFPTDAEMRCMTWTAIARGQKGIFWFLYQSEAVGQAMMDGLVDRQYKSRPLWDEVGRLTKELAPLTPVLGDLSGGKKLDASDKDVFAREYADSHGQAYAVVVNFDVTASHEIDLGRGSSKQTLPPGGGALVKLEKAK